MKTFLTITALVCALFCHGQQTFSFKSDGVKRQSAGVFDENGRLIRTLFTGKVFTAGTNSYTWDGKDDLGNTAPQGKYSVRLLSHNLKAEWEGTIANSSKQASNTVMGHNKHHYGYFNAAVDVYEHSNGWVYYTTGYSEGNVTLRKFHLDSSDVAVNLKVNATTEYSERPGGPSHGLAACYNICSDGQYLYASGLTWAAQTVVNGTYVMNNRVFIMKFDLNNDQMATFSAGKSIAPANYTYPSVIVLEEGLGYGASIPYTISGIAVDGTYLYAAQKDQNKISVYNKTTGAFVTSTASVQSPRRMASDGSNLWVICGSNSVCRFTVNSNGSISSTPSYTLSGLSDPQSLSIQTVGGMKYIYVADGGNNHVVKRYRVDNGLPDNGFNGGKGYFGQLGGYANNSLVTDDRFYFPSNSYKPSGISVKGDGSMWVCDAGNNRLIRYTSSFATTHKLQWQGATYMIQLVEGDSSRLLSGLTEFKVDYTSPLKSSWSLARQYEPSVKVELDKHRHFTSLVKLSNGRTYGFQRTGTDFSNGTLSGSSWQVLYELTNEGLRNTGIYKSTNYSLFPDGSLVECSVKHGSSTVVTRYALAGFDASQNPQWSGTGKTVGNIQTVGVDGVNGRIISKTTTDGKLIFFDPSAPNNGVPPYSIYHQGFHMGAIKYDTINGAASQDWLWRSVYSTSLDYRGDYPTDGKFDIGNGTYFPGGQARVSGDFITWNHHGEFWKGGQTNMHHLLYKNGLQLLQFGVAVANAQNVLPRQYPGMAGNALTTATIKVGDALYIWHGDESYHSGIHRWKVSGLNTVKEEVIPLYTTDRPEAHFNSDHQSGCAPLAVGFTDASTAGTDKITGWLWSFGDGSTATEQNPSHTYAKAGNYTVSLKVTTAAGVTNTYTSTDLVRVVSNPTATIVSDPSACVQAPVSFTGKTDVSSSSDLSWAWDFGNGQKSTAANPDPQVYAAPGNYTVSLNVKDASGCSASTKTTVSVQSAPVLTVGPDMEINAGDVAQLSASGAERYTWNNGATLSCADCATPKANPTATTTYTVTGVNSAGCSTTATVTVTVNTTEPSTSPGTPPPPPPPPPASPAQAGYNANQTSGCAPLAVGFTDASTAGTDKITGWLWSFGDGSTATEQNPSHTYTKAGNYTVSLKVTTAAGITKTYTGTTAIQVNGVPAVRIIGDSVGCVQAKATFKGQTDVAAGTALSWSWDFGNGQNSTAANPDPQVYAVTGSYPVTASVKTEDGCVAKAVATYSVKSAPLLSVNPAVQVCTGSAAQLSASGAERYTWNNGATLSCTDCATPKASPTATTTYTVTGLNSAGCNTTATVTVRVQERQMLTLAKADAICTGETVNLKASGTDLYQWVASADIKTPTAGETIAKPQSSTVYTVIGKDALGCFADTASIAVTVHALPKISAGPDVEVCKGSAKQLTATGGTRYQWQADATLSCSACASPLVAPASNANYIVTGTDAYGCSARDTVAVTVHQPFQLNVDQPTDICIGGTARLSATGADQYSWSPASSVAQPTAGVTTATPPASMRYTVTAKDNHNCFTDTASVVVTVWPIPTVEAGDVKELSVGNSLELKPTYSSDVTRYKWTPAETLNCSTCPSPYANPTTETTYTVEVSNNGGCKASASVTVHVICNGGNLFIPNTFSPNGDGRNDRFYVKGVGVNKVKSLKVYNRWGDLVFARENMPANNENVGWDGTYKGQQLPSDVYIYSCEVVCQNNELLTYKGDVTLLR